MFPIVVAAALLMSGCENAREADRHDLSATHPDETLPVAGNSSAPHPPPRANAAPVSQTTTGLATTQTSGDDSGFDADTTATAPDASATDNAATATR